MDTTFQEIIYQVISLVALAVITYVGTYLKRLIAVKIDSEKYSYEKSKLNQILADAVLYAEQASKEYAKDVGVAMSGDEKLNTAKKYINMVDRGTVVKYSKDLNDLIKKEVAVQFGT